MTRERPYGAGALPDRELIHGRPVLLTVLALAMLLLVGCSGPPVDEPTSAEQRNVAGSGVEPDVAEGGLTMIDEEFAFVGESADFCFELLEIDALGKFSSISVGLVIAEPEAIDLARDLADGLRSLNGLPSDLVEPNTKLAESIEALVETQSEATVANLAEDIRLWSDALARHCELA